MTADPREELPAHARTAEDVLLSLVGDGERGLTDSEAQRRLEHYGENSLPEAPEEPVWRLFARQLASPLVGILLVAALVALALGEHSDATVIAVVVVLNAMIGGFQEGRAQRSLSALRRVSRQKASVIRDGEQRAMEARLLVPGDLLVVSAGDAVLADARVLESASLSTSEAALTGESVPVVKDREPRAVEDALVDRSNMLYAGTSIAAGRGRALVVSTGQSTELGRIAELAEAGREPPTPLEARVAQFGRVLAACAFGTFVLIAIVGLLRALPFGHIVMIGISQVVGMVPEGLPVAMTVALAIGVTRMARRGAIVRRLSAVETLGATTIIASDKTGTLTRNEMTVTSVWLPKGREIRVEGSGYEPIGKLLEGTREVALPSEPDLPCLLEAAVLCNDARIAPPSEEDPRHRPIGDPTEASLVTLAAKAGIDVEALRARTQRAGEIPFDAGRKWMATEHTVERTRFVIVKGAPEVLLSLCGQVQIDGRNVPLDNEQRALVQRACEALAGRALRLLAVARAEDVSVSQEGDMAASFRGRATLLGVVGQLDPPRAEAGEAVLRCRAAGIRAVMITGDHTATGLAIARALSMAGEHDRAISGAELAALSDDQLDRQLDRISVFARVEPAQKLRIVKAYQRRGHVVAMTGDGVNDAPALLRADVGVAMGITGTEVAKQAAKIVVTDDNFASIVAAIEEGRLVYRNIKKALLLLFSTSIAEVIVLVGALVMGLPPPFVAVQILWNNLVTEGVITVNLIMEPSEGDEMSRPPVPRAEPLITPALWRRVGLLTPTIAGVSLLWFFARLRMGVPLEVVRTEAFTLLVVCEWYNVLNCRSELHSALSMSLFKNYWLLGGLLLGNVLQALVVYAPPLNGLFHTVPLDFAQVLWIGLVGSLVLWVEELRKLFARRSKRVTKARATGAPART